MDYTLKAVIVGRFSSGYCFFAAVTTMCHKSIVGGSGFLEKYGNTKQSKIRIVPKKGLVGLLQEMQRRRIKEPCHGQINIFCCVTMDKWAGAKK